MRLPRLFKSPQSLRGNGIHELIQEWFETPEGRGLVTQERALCDQILPDMFGYHLLQLGLGMPYPLCDSSPIHHKVYVAEKIATDASTSSTDNVSVNTASMFSGLGDLAIATDSIDVAVLHHCLDFTLDPQRVLREVYRVIIPGGKVVIVGFNPWSIWGMWRLLKAHSATVPWCARFLSPYRLSDWLGVLGFHVDGYESTHFGIPPPGNRLVKFDAWLNRVGAHWWNHMGAAYVMVATKQVSRLTPLKPVMRPSKAALIPIPLKTQPTSRNIHDLPSEVEDLK